MNKTDLLFHMMERPQDYTEQQWQEILSDEECRELYTLMAKTQSAIDSQKEIDDKVIDAEWKRLTTSSRRSRLRVAAMFAGILVATGIAIAAIRMVLGESHKYATQEVVTSINSQRIIPAGTDGDIVVFDNVQLDSVLDVVARHYQKQVAYRNDDVRTLHFHIEWNQTAPLNDFITLINNFEGISLREENDTIIAE